MTLEKMINYPFKDKKLLERALAHPSLSSEMRPAPPDNQRLEFLGDAILDLIISEELYHRHPDYKEGQLTKIRASIVSRPALAAVARRLKLGKELNMSRGEESSGGRERDSNLADTVESVIGAVYLDSDLPTCAKIVLQIFQPELANINADLNSDNPKGALQESLQANSDEAPTYLIISEEGPPHDRTYRAEVKWSGQKLGVGEGNSKKSAEINAAENALREKVWVKKNKA